MTSKQRWNDILRCDAHADILWKMDQNKVAFYEDDSVLQQNYQRLCQSGIGLQVFALYSSSHLSSSEKLQAVLRYIDVFNTEIIQDGSRMFWVQTVSDLQTLMDERNGGDPGRVGGLLSLEGGDCLQGDIHLLRVLYRLGVRAIGLTWNNPNEIADGVGESRGAGLTSFGRMVVEEMEKLSMIVDLAHISEAAYWDVFDVVSRPPIVSHANVKSVWNHRRNLTDRQIKAIIECKGFIGLSFVPPFISEGTHTIEDWLRHLEHVLELGGEDVVGLGSDFDGTDSTMSDITDGSRLPLLWERLEKRYGKRIADKVAGQNFVRVLSTLLPAEQADSSRITR